MQFQMDQAVEILSDTPAVLNALLRNKSNVWLHCRKTPESFSPVDVIGHLMLADITNWLPRVQLILEHQDTTPFPPFDRFAFQPLIENKPIGELLDNFADLRQTSLHALLDLNIEEQQLALTGMHPEFGTVTLSNLLSTWAVHDIGHIAQVLKIMSNEYGDAVGPWRAYLSILN